MRLYTVYLLLQTALHSSEISPTRCTNCVFILRNGFTLHVSGDSLTHHQEYNAVYGHSKFRLLGVDEFNICGSVHHALYW